MQLMNVIKYDLFNKENILNRYFKNSAIAFLNKPP